jgi:putative endonuclease
VAIQESSRALRSLDRRVGLRPPRHDEWRMPSARLRASREAREMKHPAVYIMANERNGTLYVGVTSDIAQRAFQHRSGAIKGFTQRYGCKMLVWFEPHERMDEAIAREKQIKSGSRKDKIALIERDNPLWTDLYETLNA